MMEIFVTGGSGFVGAATIARLAERGHRVRAMSRSAESDATVRAAGAEPVRCDLENVAASHVAGAEVVVHAAAFVEAWGPEDAWERINVDGTRRMLAAAREAGLGLRHAGAAPALHLGAGRPHAPARDPGHGAGRAVELGRPRPREAYFILDDGTRTLHDMVSALAEAAGVSLPEKSVPYGLAHALGGLLEFCWRTFRLAGAPPLTRHAAMVMGRDCTLVGEKAHRELGYLPRVSVAEGLQVLRAALTDQDGGAASHAIR